MKLSFMVICCWINLFLFPFAMSKYIKTGNFTNRFGQFSGTNARDAMIGHIALTILLGGYAISETYKVYFKKKNENDSTEKK